MTSIICWRNQEETDGLWAVSDSRVSSGSSVMTDNCPKLFSLVASTFLEQDYLKLNPKRLFTFGFGFAGSTLIGTNVKEMLSMFVSNLSEINYYDMPDYPFEDKLPSLMDVAVLSKKIAERYIHSMGQCFPQSARCEFVIFGYCPKYKKYTAIKLSNCPSSPAEIKLEEVDVSNGAYLILGDQKERIGELVEDNKSKFEVKSLNWWRSPFIALANILREEDAGSIGGYLQFCLSTELDTRLHFLTPKDELCATYIGFKLFEDINSLGGFSIQVPGGMTMPDVDGWSFTNKN
ncbi:hypothetical protein [Vibrio sp. SCSIO 43136]|uniref:hypothetical protein n=1 Tax=Vibrio sp. SCSIO 43136 TaxID=2819101 RepID=UPI0020763F4F|nr:hypothetical protein [Vibrio sp. SCSIO 43136]USD65822.1 hypothetical protein J4N39_03075 [Vibrio sp. SCSIO 43136]